VIYTIARTNIYENLQSALAQMLWVAVFILLAFFALCAQSPNIASTDENTLIIEQPQGEIYSFGKNVIVRGNAKGVLVFGGDAIIEGALTVMLPPSAVRLFKRKRLRSAAT
jgi:hypothetical protein